MVEIYDVSSKVEAKMATRKLGATQVYRGGLTARSRKYETDEVEIQSRIKNQELRLDFCMDSKGGGTTEVYVDVGPADFAILLQAMAEVDRNAAMAAMSAELAKQISEQPKHDEKKRAEARESILDAAESKYIDAPSGNDHAERFLYEAVKKIVAELERKSKPARSTSGNNDSAEPVQVH